MERIPRNTGPKPNLARSSAWRVWLVETPLWIAFFCGSILFGVGGVIGLLRASVADIWIAGFAYTVVMPAFVLSPGRGNRGYNPFGAVVRKAAPGLIGLHVVCVSVFMGMVALHESTSPSTRLLHAFSARHPDFADLFLIGGPVLLVVVQGVRSYDLLEKARREIAAAQ